MATGDYALFGHPVAHSLSPRIHAAFARQAGVAMRYTAIDTPGGLAVALDAFAARGGRGGNVTLPHKHAALACCSELSPRALRCGAVNTLLRRGGNWYGDNTDGVGLVRDLTVRQGHDLQRRRTLLFGAGGAAAGIAPALLDAGIGALCIVNRNRARAEALAVALAAPERAQAGSWPDLDALGTFDLIVNATAAARNAEPLALPAHLAAPGSVAVDLGYGPAATPFLDWARDAGVEAAIDGLGMLVEQAAEGFALWHGRQPATNPVYAALRLQLAATGTA